MAWKHGDDEHNQSQGYIYRCSRAAAFFLTLILGPFGYLYLGVKPFLQACLWWFMGLAGAMGFGQVPLITVWLWGPILTAILMNPVKITKSGIEAREQCPEYQQALKDGKEAIHKAILGAGAWFHKAATSAMNSIPSNSKEDSPETRIAKLHMLKERGAISQSDFEVAKQELLKKIA